MITRTPFEIHDLAPATADFREDVLRGLAAPDKALSCKYFYDQVGSQLFERICTLPEYYPARSELAILRRHSPEMAHLLGPDCLLLEYGSGSSTKTRLLLDHLTRPAGYVPIDISREHLRAAAYALARDYPGLEIRPVCADFTAPLTVPSSTHAARRRVIYFPGSTIGNFMPAAAQTLLEQTADLCGRGGGLLLGADLKKDPRLLHAAYNDRQGVTAAFNLNLLVRINRELGANFQTDQFWHYAFYNPRAGRVEMYLLSRVAQRVTMAEQEIFFTEGEAICTEYSHKYSLDELRMLAQQAGFAVDRVWTDELNYFGVLYLRRPD
ncbi:MAG TPA: L-histidine N(alpha)-methyltransferase [Candidatus Binataceae bacterium]|nr:L-histidine N(alpha)-methyltransferase [Candidatus Binataceae bacterium]